MGQEMSILRKNCVLKVGFQNYKKKIPTSVNARLIDHNPASVDRYIKDGLRVEKLYNDGYPEWEIPKFPNS